MQPLKCERLTIHAGLHKTGTTSIQAYLVTYLNALLSHKILYDVSEVFSNNKLNHWKIRRQLDKGIQMIQTGMQHVIISSEDILLEINPKRFGSDFFAHQYNSLSKHFKRISIVITMPLSIEELCRKLLQQELRGTACSTKDHLRAYLYDYLCGISNSLKMLKCMGAEIVLIHPSKIDNSNKTDIINPFINYLLPMSESDYFLQKYNKYNRLNETNNREVAKDLLYGFTRQSIAECRYHELTDWWSLFVQQETEYVFEDFTIGGSLFIQRFSEIINMLISAVLDDEGIKSSALDLKAVIHSL